MTENQDEMWLRIREHRKATLKHEKKDESSFKAQATLGKFPTKCLPCYLLGLRWCKFWETNFSCEEYEIGELEEIAKKFV
jgi:hypothetical protein